MEFRIQRSEFGSTRRVLNGWCHGRQNARSVSVVNANRNDNGQWNVNVNRLGNDNAWNDENRFFFRNYAFSPEGFVPEGFFFCKNSLHPKSIFPASTKVVDILMYFLSSIILHSQATVRKNLAKSFLVIDSITKSIFLIPLAYVLLNERSKVSRSNLSIFAPIVCL